MRETKRGKGFSLLAKHILFMGNKQVTEFVSPTLVHLWKLVNVYELLLGKIDEKSVGKQKYGLL